MTGPESSRAARLRRASVTLVEAADAEGVVVRILGGIAVALRCESARGDGPLSRDYSDIDVVTTRKQARRLSRVMEQAGYQPDERFNASHGDTRLSFCEPAQDEQVDVFIDEFRLCHVLPLADRLTLHSVTVSLEDLLLSKLQVAKLDKKDVTDAVAILADHDLGGDQGIRTDYITRLLANDWGWWRTSTETIHRILGLLGSLGLPDVEAARVRTRFQMLGEAIEAAPKSLKWRARARIGERRAWRVDPEELGG